MNVKLVGAVEIAWGSSVGGDHSAYSSRTLSASSAVLITSFSKSFITDCDSSSN